MNEKIYIAVVTGFAISITLQIIIMYHLAWLVGFLGV